MITLDQAKKALVAAEKKAKEIGVQVTTVIVDQHGSTIAVSRMDGAIPISPRFAYEKAFTSANLGAPTEKLAKFAGEGKPYFGLTNIFGGEITTIAGGIPIMLNNQLMGGIGVGGSMNVSDDAQCAQTALESFQ